MTDFIETSYEDYLAEVQAQERRDRAKFMGHGLPLESSSLDWWRRCGPPAPLTPLLPDLTPFVPWLDLIHQQEDEKYDRYANEDTGGKFIHGIEVTTSRKETSA
jgi:hypothetical protein